LLKRSSGNAQARFCGEILPVQVEILPQTQLDLANAVTRHTFAIDLLEQGRNQKNIRISQ